MKPAEEQKQRAGTVKDWLNHPAWEQIIYPEMENDIKRLNTELIETNDLTREHDIKLELRVRKKFLDKLTSYLLM